MMDLYKAAADIIRSADYCTGFTGAGISVDSGIPPFRGPKGLWNRYDPSILELSRFKREPEECWPVIRELFFDHFTAAVPNSAHLLMSRMEKEGMLKSIITQNIDNLHQRAGSKNVIEYHGNSRYLLCMECGRKAAVTKELLSQTVPRCSCGGVYKPDFIFFGEAIPEEASLKSLEEAQMSDVMILVGTTGEVYPAAMIPRTAAKNGTTIIEINPEPSSFTGVVSDIYLSASAVEAADCLFSLLFSTVAKIVKKTPE
jgi:NAD-dependent deacetylase